MPIIQVGSRPTKDGLVFFLPGAGRDAHLTYYVRDGKMNVHITDTSKKPSKVWDSGPISVDELVKKIERRFRRTLMKYHPNQKMYVFSPEIMSMLLSANSELAAKEGGHGAAIDFFQLARAFVNEYDDKRAMKKIFIKDAHRLNIPFGFLSSKTQTYMVIPLEDGHCARINMDIRRGILGAVPMGRALDAWMDYLDEEGILDVIVEPIKGPLIERIRDLSAGHHSQK